MTTEFIGDDDGNLTSVRTIDVELKDGSIQPIAGSERTWPTDLLIIAMGFVSPEQTIATKLGLDVDQRNNIHAECVLLSVETFSSEGARVVCSTSGMATIARLSRACSQQATAVA